MIDRLALPDRVAGDIALDLANTINRRGTSCAVDHLADADAILRWAEDAGVVDPGFTVAPLKRQALLATVHRLRGAVISAGTAIADGNPPPAPALDAIREIAARSLTGATLEGSPPRLGFIGADRLLGPLAWAALDLLRGAELDRLKRCEAEDCRWLFLDRSRNGSRRWCDTATCGTPETERAHTGEAAAPSAPEPNEPALQDRAPGTSRWQPRWNRATRTRR
ncbi:putative RNA-binding Zn ribbon-like protein [Sphingomonas zeicaulis]|uniref:CGNR zinc finger domain-containing protein n=1 Tax=Sphingomonas zeicaulis TaxID=1632740 RepID=UPI003D23E093